MPTTYRALLIPASLDDPIREVVLTVVDGSTLASLLHLVGGLIEALPYPGREDLTAYVNEEGKFDQEANPPNRRALRLFESVLFAGDWIAGDLVIAGFDANTGETVELPAGFTVESVDAALVA